MTFITVAAGVAPSERIAAGQHLVQDHAEGKHIAARVDRAAERLLRRQVAGDAVRVGAEAFGDDAASARAGRRSSSAPARS